MERSISVIILCSLIIGVSNILFGLLMRDFYFIFAGASLFIGSGLWIREFKE